jgi:hypothetical protein
VYYPRQKNQTARARAFIDFLVTRFQAPFTPVDTGVEPRERRKRSTRK